jgi:hypothetical protein
MHQPGFAAAATSALLLLATGAEAQTTPSGTALPCHDYREIARQLGATYEETPVSLGLQSDGNLLQVFASARSGTWTIVSTTPNGFACVIAAGRNWEAAKVAIADPAA